MVVRVTGVDKPRFSGGRVGVFGADLGCLGGLPRGRFTGTAGGLSDSVGVAALVSESNSDCSLTCERQDVKALANK